MDMEEKELPLVTVCVAAVRGDTLPYLIASLARQTYRSWEMVIAAQGNDAGLEAVLNEATERDPRVRALRLDVFGKCRALNQAVLHARGEVFAFTDDDCEAAPDWLEVTMDCLHRVHDAGVVAGACVASAGKPFRVSTCPATYPIECVYRPAEQNYRAPAGFYWGGGNFAVRRETMELVGPFDEYLGPGAVFQAAEDVDWGYRAEARGVVMVTTPRSITHHTYGRRYGLKAMLSHWRSYATGSGAVEAKCQVWGRGDIRGHQLSATPGWRIRLRRLMRPHQMLKAHYRRSAVQAAKERYLAEYTVDPQWVTVPKRVETS
jgi:GT2 family glycosyltransferase